MERLPPYITAVHEGGRKVEALGPEERALLDAELAELRRDIDSLDPDLRKELEYMLGDPETDEFVFKTEDKT